MSCSRTTTQWRRWGSNPRPFGLESSTLPLSHCAPYISHALTWSFSSLSDNEAKYLPPTLKSFLHMLMYGRGIDQPLPVPQKSKVITSIGLHIIFYSFTMETRLISWPWGYKTWVQAQTQNKAQWLAACGHVSANSQSLRFILSLRMNSSFITSRPGLHCPYRSWQSETSDDSCCVGWCCSHSNDLPWKYHQRPFHRCVCAIHPLLVWKKQSGRYSLGCLLQDEFEVRNSGTKRQYSLKVGHILSQNS